MRLFLKDNVIVKDMMAVLAAVTEIIKENGGKETETEYFAALMSALEVCVLKFLETMDGNQNSQSQIRRFSIDYQKP